MRIQFTKVREGSLKTIFIDIPGNTVTSQYLLELSSWVLSDSPQVQEMPVCKTPQNLFLDRSLLVE